MKAFKNCIRFILPFFILKLDMNFDYLFSSSYMQV